MKYFHYDNDGYLIGFDTVRFIKDYNYNVSVYQSLLDQLAEITEIHGISDAPKVQITPTNDGMENLVMRVFSLKNKIAAYRHYFMTYDTAMKHLSEPDKKLLRIMYGDTTAHPLDSAMREFNISRSEVYRRLKIALNRFRDHVIGDSTIKEDPE